MTDKRFIRKSEVLMTKKVSGRTTHYQLMSATNPFPTASGKKYTRRDHMQATPLSRDECKLVRDIYSDTPSVKIGADTFKSHLFKNPFNVYFGSRDKDKYYAMKPEVQQKIINSYWMPWLGELFDRLKLDGIAPFYYKKISLKKSILDVSDKTTEDLVAYHLVPTIPPVEAGEIFTYINGKEQEFYWKWTNEVPDESAGLEDGSVYFIVRHAPSLNGKLNSPMKSLIKDYAFIELVEFMSFRLGEALSNPLHVIGYNPDLKDAGATAAAQNLRHPGEHNPNYSTGSSAMFVSSTPPNLKNNLQLVEEHRNQVGANGRTPYSDLGLPDDVSNRIMGTAHISEAIRNMGNSYGSKPGPSDRFNAVEAFKRVRSGRRYKDDGDLLDEETASVEDRLNLSRMNNTMLLKPYEYYVQGAQPSNHNYELKYLKQRFDQMAAAINGFPISSLVKDGSMLNSTATSNVLEDNLKSETSWFSSIIKEVFSIAYTVLANSSSSVEPDTLTMTEISSTDVETQPERKEKMLALAHASEIEIVFPRIPNQSFENYAILYQHRMIPKEAFLTYGLDCFGLSQQYSTKPSKEYMDNIAKLYPILDPLADAGGPGANNNRSKRTGGTNTASPTKRQRVEANDDNVDERPPVKRQRTGDKAPQTKQQMIEANDIDERETFDLVDEQHL